MNRERTIEEKAALAYKRVIEKHGHIFMMWSDISIEGEKAVISNNSGPLAYYDINSGKMSFPEL